MSELYQIGNLKSTLFQENSEEVEKKAQLSDLLKSGVCKVEFGKGDFCAAKYSFSDARNVTSSAWYRAMVIEVLRKRSTK